MHAVCSGYNLEQWYPFVKDHTAKTVIVAMTDVELRSLARLYSISSERACYRTDLDAKVALEHKVQRAVWEKCDFGSRRFFVKTSMRSPKDGIILGEKEAAMTSGEKLSQEIAALAVTDSQSAIGLLSRSRRVADDIGFHLKYACKGTASSDFNLVFREWDPAIERGIEWRCFVSQGKLTTISQYHCYDVLPTLQNLSVEQLSEIRRALVAFQQKIHLLIAPLRYSSYVLDVVLLDTVSLEIRLIEINPFICSGSGLFQWNSDSKLLHEGSSVSINSENPFPGGVAMRILSATEAGERPTVVGV